MPPQTEHLSQTPTGKAWLANFEVSERESAALLADSLDFVPSAVVAAEMQQLVLRELQKAPGPSALYYARNVTDEHLELGFGVTGLPELANSALDVARLLEGVRPADLLVEPDLEALRGNRVRRVFVATDVMLSGNEVSRFLAFFLRNKSIKSWVSFGWLEFVVLAHGVTRDAERLVNARARTAAIEYVRIIRTFNDAAWTTAEKESIADLCRRYAKPSRMAFGYCEVASLTVYEHSVSNGLPSLLIRPSSRVWQSLLSPGKRHQVPPEIRQAIFRISIVRTLKGLFKYMNERGDRWLRRSLYRRQGLLRIEPTMLGRQILVVLVAMSSKYSSIPRTQHLTGMSATDVEEVIRIAKELGYLDSAAMVTRMGKAFVKRAAHNRLGRNPRFILADSDSYYYPRSLR